jgi:hypothetical protein
MRPFRPLLFSLLLVSFGCSDDPAPGATPATTPDGGAAACEEGERAAGDGCEPILPAEECAPGTRAEIGSETCVPVGPQTCPSGFEKHPSGWGCRPIMPDAACEGATRDALGSKTCVPIGDCGAAFPPAGASVFVDASFTAGELDASHVKTIAEGIAAAGAGATIAVAPGTYPENLEIQKSVTIVGKCAAEVVLDSPTTAAGIDIASGKTTVRGITVRGGDRGISVVSAASSLAVEDVLLEANVRAGIDAFEEAKVAAKRVVIRKTIPSSDASITNGIFADVVSVLTFEDGVISGAADAGIGMTGESKITFTRSIVRDTVPRPDGVGGSGARGFEKGRIELVESAIVASRGTGVLIGKTKASLKMDRSSIVDTKLDERAGDGIAFPVSASDGAIIEVNESTLADNPSIGFFITKAGTKATIKKTAVIHTYAAGETGGGVALGAKDGSTVDIDDSVFVDAAFAALQSDGAGTKLTVSRSLVADLKPSIKTFKAPEIHGGAALTVIRGASATMTSCTIDRALEEAVAAGNAKSVLLLDRTVVKRTQANDQGLFGHGVLAVEGGTVAIQRSAFDDNVGVGIVVSNASASVQRSSVRRNTVGVHVQKGSSLLETAEVPDPIEPGTVVVTPDSRFIENGSKVGTGELPLPGSLLQP